jgi:membrane associated rhomboid family serine protease
VKRLPFLTVALIAACVIVALITSFGADDDRLQWLFIARPDGVGLEDIEAGQVWRLVTPLFLHFGPLHLLFNMMWLWSLGGMIEARRGYWFLGGFVAVIGVPANVAQYLASGPLFGGMSGVIYGLLAYIWMKSRVDANAGYVLRRFDVVTCAIWFVLCWTGLVGPIGNWAHTAGLIGGVAWGYVEPATARRPIGLPSTRRGRLMWVYLPLGCVIAVIALSVTMEHWARRQGCAGELDLSPDQQIAICSMILKSNTANAQTRAQMLVDRGNAYWATGRHDLAIKDHDEAIALDPGNARAFAGRGLAKRAAGQTASGKADIDRARQIDAEVGTAYPALRYWDMSDAALAGVDPQDSGAVEAAMRDVLHRMLADMPPDAPDDTISGARSISFRTDADGVAIPDRLRTAYPTQMTIILQHQYKNLVVTPQTVAVTVSFNRVWETLLIPLQAITAFEDGSAHFSIAFGGSAATEAAGRN